MPTVADLIGAALVRAGARAVFTSGGVGPRSRVPGEAESGTAGATRSSSGSAATALVEAVAEQGLRAVDAGRGAAACVMAAVAGWLTDAPGLAVLALDDDADVSDALARAFRDRAPLIAVTDRPLRTARGDAVKASLAVSAESAAHLAAHACQLALTEPRGPVHLVVTADTAAASAVPVATAVRPASLPAADPELLDRAAALLGSAQRPVLVAGGQCRSPEIAMWVRALAEALPAPVVVTRRGRGVLPDPHPLNFGPIDASKAGVILRRADIVVAIGLEPEEVRPGGVSPRPCALRLAASAWTRPADSPHLDVTGEIAALVEELAPRLRGRTRADWDVAELDRLKRAPRPPSGAAGLPDPVPVATAVQIAREATPAGTVAIVAADGLTDAIAALWQVVGPGELLALAPPCRPGFALAAAVAAGIARPATRVVCFASASQLAPAETELDLAARLALPVTVVLVGGVDDTAADLLSTAPGRGWLVARARDRVEMGMAMERALAAPGPALLDARG